MTMISLNRTPVPFTHCKKLVAAYLSGCNRHGLDWLFDQIANRSFAFLLLLAGYISEVTNWF